MSIVRFSNTTHDCICIYYYTEYSIKYIFLLTDGYTFEVYKNAMWMTIRYIYLHWGLSVQQ